MARFWQYPRWRRVLMQAALVLILAGTVALAEFITRQRNRSSTLELTQTRTIDDRLTVNLPRNWTLRNDVDDPRMLIATEPMDNSRRRVLILRIRHVHGISSAQEFLRRSGLLNSIPAEGDGEQGDPSDSIATNSSTAPLRPIMMAGWPGIMTRVLHARPSQPDAPPIISSEFIAAALLPSQNVIILQLTSDEPDIDGSDALLVQQIASSMQVAGEAPLANQSSISLADGLTLKVPAGYEVLPQLDANLTNRAILLPGKDGHRLLIELAPCVYFPTDSPDEIRTMLLLHYPSLATMGLKESAGIWRAESTETDADRITGARTITRPDGNSVLLICFAGSIDGQDFKNAYDVLSKDIVEDAAPSCSALIQTGEATARALAGRKFESGSAEVMDDQWWLLRERHDNLAIGWMHIWPNPGISQSAALEFRAEIDKQVTRLIQGWSTDAGKKTYQYEMKLNHSLAETPDADEHFALVSEQSTLLRRGKLLTRVRYKQGQTESPGDSAPSAYVPMGWFIGGLGRLNSPMILRSEALPGPQDVALVQPMTLLITPTDRITFDDGGQTPLRCLSVEISGTGMVNRYYFRPDATLETIEYPGDLEQIRSDEVIVKHRFANDSLMAP